MYTAVVVEDEKWVLRGILSTIPWKKYDFTVAYSTTKARLGLDFILATPPDVVFVDIRMPTLNGMELLTIARQAGVTSEFVILSGLQEYEYFRTSIQYGVFDFILKPITEEKTDEVLKKLRHHLDAVQSPPLAFGDVDAVTQVHERRKGVAPAAPQDVFDELTVYIRNHFEQDLRLNDLAGSFYITPNYISRLFRQRLGTTYTDYLNGLRLEKANTLLTQTGLSVEQIAQTCGYNDAQYFCHVYRKYTNRTPLQYRKGLR